MSGSGPFGPMMPGGVAVVAPGGVDQVLARPPPGRPAPAPRPAGPAASGGRREHRLILWLSVILLAPSFLVLRVIPSSSAIHCADQIERLARRPARCRAAASAAPPSASPSARASAAALRVARGRSAARASGDWPGRRLADRPTRPSSRTAGSAAAPATWRRKSPSVRERAVGVVAVPAVAVQVAERGALGRRSRRRSAAGSRAARAGSPTSRPARDEIGEVDVRGRPGSAWSAPGSRSGESWSRLKPSTGVRPASWQTWQSLTPGIACDRPPPKAKAPRRPRSGASSGVAAVGAPLVGGVAPAARRAAARCSGSRPAGRRRRTPSRTGCRPGTTQASGSEASIAVPGGSEIQRRLAAPSVQSGYCGAKARCAGSTSERVEVRVEAGVAQDAGGGAAGRQGRCRRSAKAKRPARTTAATHRAQPPLPPTRARILDHVAMARPSRRHTHRRQLPRRRGRLQMSELRAVPSCCAGVVA